MQGKRLLTCPACHAPATAVRSGSIEYDRCHACGGVWLDRGELEQIIALAYRSGKERAARTQTGHTAMIEDEAA